MRNKNNEGYYQVIEESSEYKIMKQLFDNGLNTFVEKTHDYGASFFHTYDSLGDDGIVGAYSRIKEKFGRFEHFVLNLRNKEGYSVKESLSDTLIDMAVYSFMTVAAIIKANAEAINNQANQIENVSSNPLAPKDPTPIPSPEADSGLSINSPIVIPRRNTSSSETRF